MMEDDVLLIYYGETAVMVREVAQGITALTALAMVIVVFRFLWVYRTMDTVFLAASALLLYVSGTGFRAWLEWYRTFEAGRGNRLDFEWLAMITTAGAVLTIAGGIVCIYGFLPDRLRLPVSLISGVVALVVPILVLSFY